MSPLATLGPLGILAGAGATWVFRRTTDGRAIRTEVNRIEAHLLEFWLYADEPAAISQSWWGLVVANARLLRLILAPVAILTIVTLPLVFYLDACYGTSPLPVGRPAVVTLQFDQPLDALSSLPVLQAPAGMTVESPPVHVFSQRQVSWRIRPLRELSGELQCVVSGRAVVKSVAAGIGFPCHSRRRTRSLLELIRYPAEAPLPRGAIEWIEISYLPATLAFLGMEIHWSIWFLAFSLAGALVARYLFQRNGSDFHP
jgi:hypothetical protein